VSAIARSWLAFAAVGSGLIHLALVLGAPTAIGAVLVVIGVVEFGWGVLAFARERVPAPRAALAGALLPVLGWAGLALGAPHLAAQLGFVPLGIAAVLQLAAAVLLARSFRTRSAPPAPGLARYVLGLVAGVIVVGALTATALAASEVLPSVPEAPDHTPH
jgi:hypothetical protein